MEANTPYVDEAAIDSDVLNDVVPGTRGAAAARRFPTDKPRVTAPVPVFVKAGLGVAAIIMVGMVAAGGYYLSSKTTATDSGNVSLPVISPFEIGGAINAHDQHNAIDAVVTPVVIDDPVPAGEAQPVAENAVAVDTLETRYTALLSEIARLNGRIDALIAATAGRDKDLDALRLDVTHLTDSRIPALVAADRSVAVTVDAMRSSLDRIERVTQETTRRKNEVPPFSVKSIDEWGTAASALLTINGTTIRASVGEVHSGWKIAHIAWPDCIYVVRSREAESGTVKLCKAGL